MEYPTKLSEEVEMLGPEVEQAQLNEKGLLVMKGMTRALAHQLVEVSKQGHIHPFCTDATGRFRDLEAITTWQAKGRLALPLVEKVGDNALRLLGFAWTGPSVPDKPEVHMPDASITFAFRLYEGALSKGYAFPYIKAAIQANHAMYETEGVWLETWGDNLKAVKTYEKVGFETVAEVLDTREGKKVPRLYMALGASAMS